MIKTAIEWLIFESDVSRYQIHKATGIAQSTLSDYATRKTDIGRMPLDTAEKLYAFYLEEVKEMEKIKKLIKQVENLEIELEDIDPNYHIKEYVDGAPDHYIVHRVEGTDIEVFFAEHDHIKEMRNQIYNGEKTEDDFANLVINELADQFNYDKVVAYRVDGGPIEWL